MFESNGKMQIYYFGDFRLDLFERRLIRKGKRIPLPPKTFQILRILVENNGCLVTKEELFRTVWPNQYLEENNLTVRISALRKVLEESIENQFIQTVFGSGYIFVSQVRRVHATDSNATDESGKRLAVLPLRNENMQNGLDYLCDGLTESLINSLSRLSEFRIISLSSVSRFRVDNVDPITAGKELMVEAVLVGSLRLRNDALMFRMEVINVNDGARIWGTTIERKAHDFFKLQDAITKEVTRNFQVRLNRTGRIRLTKRHTKILDAYHLYMKGRYFWSVRSVAGLSKSIVYFKRAIKLDPKYALAYSGLADARRMLSDYGLVSPRSAMPKALAAATKALQLDPELPEAHISLGLIKTIFEWDWSGAEKLYRRAIDLDSNNATAHQYFASLLARFGYLDRAVEEVQKAFDVNPLSFHVQLSIARITYLARRYNESIAHARSILEMNPNLGAARGILGMIFLQQRQYEVAIEEIRKFVSSTEGDVRKLKEKITGTSAVRRTSDPDTEALGILGHAYARAGQRDEALKVLARLRNGIKNRYVEPLSIALVYTGLGDNDGAFKWLEKSLEEKSNSLTYVKVWPLFDPISDDPRFGRLIKRIGIGL